MSGSLIEPEDDGGGNADGGHEVVSSSVVSGVYAPPVLESSEHVLDLVALAVEDRIVRDLRIAVGFRQSAGFDLARGQGLAEPVGVVTLVAEQDLGPTEGVDRERSPL